MESQRTPRKNRHTIERFKRGDRWFVGIDSFTRQYTYDLLYRTGGITTVLATIFAENTVSLKAGRKFLQKIGRIWYISMLGGRTRVLWWPNPKIPRLVPAPRASRSSEQQAFG